MGKNHCIQYEGNERHAKTVVVDKGLQGDSKGLDAATVKEDDGTDETEDYTEAGSKRHRSLAAAVNVLSLDRPDLHYAASVLGWSTSRPTAKSEAWLKRVARHLLAHPRFVHTYCRGVASEVLKLVVWSDSDMADCRASRKRARAVESSRSAAGSRSRRITRRQSLCPHQASIALSSGEAEFLCPRGELPRNRSQRCLSSASDLGWKPR